MTRIIYAAQTWESNGHMIADVFALHAKPTDVVVDSTYGKGNFWTVHRPTNLTGHDRYAGPCKDGVDWGDLPEADESVDIVVFDPEYVARGGRKTSTIKGMAEAYGMDQAAPTPEALWSDMTRGIDEAQRVLKRGGLLMVKFMPYISSGQFQNALYWFWQHIDLIGMKPYDWFVYVGDAGPQPKADKCKKCVKDVAAQGKVPKIGVLQRFVIDDAEGNGHYEDEGVCDKCGGTGEIPRRQVHSRNNASHLMIAQKSKSRKR